MDKEHAKPCISVQNKDFDAPTVRDDVKLTPYSAPCIELCKKKNRDSTQYTEMLDPGETCKSSKNLLENKIV